MGIEQEIRQLLGPDDEPNGRRYQLRRAGDLFQRIVELVNDHQPGAEHDSGDPLVLLLVAHNGTCTHYAAVDLAQSDEGIPAAKVFGALQIATFQMREDSMAELDDDAPEHPSQVD